MSVRENYTYIMCKLARAVTLFGLLLLSLAPATAQNWPTRPIKIIVSQAAGGAPDIICRLISERLSTLLGEQVVVEDRPGGANVVGAWRQRARQLTDTPCSSRPRPRW